MMVVLKWLGSPQISGPEKFLNHQQYQPSFFFRGTWGDSMTACCFEGMDPWMSAPQVVAWTPGSSGLRESIRFLVQHQMVQARGRDWDFHSGPLPVLNGVINRGYSSYRGYSSTYNW